MSAPFHRFHVIFILVCVTSLCQAGLLEGDFGYSLGDKLPDGKILETRMNQDGSKQYRVKSSDPVTEVWVMSNKQGIIYRITGYSPELSPIACADRNKTMRKEIEAGKPGLGTYALDDADMYYDDQRTLVLQCEKTAHGKRLRIEYADDKLAEQ